MRIVRPSVELLAITPNAARLIEIAGRTCYKSISDAISDESASDFIAMLLRRGHESVIEHPSATMRIICDRGITHEIVRHRLASYSQESTRYCNYSKARFGREISVVCPGLIHESDPDSGWYERRAAMLKSEQAYFMLLDTGRSPQIARSVLPTCLKTEIVMTANFREWRHFLTLRLSPAAHPDMQPIAYQIWRILYEHCPPVFESFGDAARDYEQRSTNDGARERTG
jgi:thymidylate synthase (FAD)